MVHIQKAPYFPLDVDAHPCSLLLFSWYPGIGNAMDIHHLMKEQWICDKLKQQYLIKLPGEMKFKSKYLELDKNHSKQGNPDTDTERQMSHILHLFLEILLIFKHLCFIWNMHRHQELLRGNRELYQNRRDRMYWNKYLKKNNGADSLTGVAEWVVIH